MSVDPLSALAAGINSSIKILEVTYLLRAVGEQTADLLRTTEHVNRNVNEARRLRRLKASLISADEGSWMDAIISDTEKALMEVAQLIEPARIDTSTSKSINSKNKILWVFRDSPKVRDKHNRLSMCHQSLIGVINGLYAKDVVVIAPLPEQKQDEQPPPYSPEIEAMFNWRRQKRRRKSFTNLNGQCKSPDSQSSRSDSFSPSLASPGVELPSSPLSHGPSQVQIPGSVPSMTEGFSATAVPSSFYSSFDGADGLQVSGCEVDTSTESTKAQTNQAHSQTQPSSDIWQPLHSSDFWSTISVSQSGNFYNVPSSASVNNQQCPIAASYPIQQAYNPTSSVQSPEIFRSRESTAEEVDRPVLSRGSTRSRGRQWLACYASRGDLG